MKRRCFFKLAIASCVGMQATRSIASVDSHVGSYFEGDLIGMPSLGTYISAAKSSAGLFSVQQLNSHGEIIQSFELPKRGHSFAMNDQGCLLAIGRRPGNYFLVVNLTLSNAEPRLIAAPKNRRYYGHAVFNTTGSLVYLTENNLDSGQGVIGIYDVCKQFKRVGEFPSYGIGPHDICLDKQRGCLVVANGGVQTHPNSGRKKLNISTMRSSLAFINPNDGSLIDLMSLNEELRFNSIRHITIDANSDVYISLQNQKINSQQSLLAMYKHDLKALSVCKIPASLEASLNRYLGDISLDYSECLFATTSPRGNQVLIYRVDGEFLTACQVNDVCGVSKTNKPNEFLVTSGQGEITLLQINDELSPKLSLTANFQGKLAWDNHLFLV